MRLLTWLLLFVIAFFIALVLVLTFTQPVFKQVVGARILTVETHAIPVYMYVLGAFIAGLLFGVCAMLSGYIRSKVESGRKSRRIRELEQKLVESENMRTAVQTAVSDDAKFLPPETEE
ncbi:MAG: LapA family protein [Chitinispirillaceae bacterium]|jgi:uncharacterized membrane protein YciS (DUF1049 family)